MDKCLILMLEPRKPIYLKWVTEDELDALSASCDIGYTDCIEVLPNGEEVSLFYNEKFLCDEYGRVYLFNADGDVVGYEEDDNPDFSRDNTRVIYLNGNYHLLIGTAFIVLSDLYGRLISLRPRLIVKYERLFNRYLEVG